MKCEAWENWGNMRLIFSEIVLIYLETALEATNTSVSRCIVYWRYAYFLKSLPTLAVRLTRSSRSSPGKGLADSDRA